LLKRIDVLEQTLLAFLRQVSVSRPGVSTALGVPLLFINSDDQPPECYFPLLASNLLQDSTQAGRLALCPYAVHLCVLFTLLTLFTQTMRCLPAGIIAVFTAAAIILANIYDGPLAVLICAVGRFTHLSLLSQCNTRIFRHRCRGLHDL